MLKIKFTLVKKELGNIDCRQQNRGMKNEITLYHYWRSSCSWRVRWALAIKKVEYRAVAVNLLKAEQQSTEYLKKNPLGFVPCLEVNGNFLCESLAILEWIEEQYPTPMLLPKDPMARARARQIAQMVVSGIQPLQNLSVQKYYCPDEEKRMHDGRHWIKRGFQSIEKLLKTTAGEFCVGDTVSFADLCLIPQCYNAERYELPLSQFPKINEIYVRARKLTECRASEPVSPE